MKIICLKKMVGVFDAQVPAPHGARIEHWDSGKDEVKGTAERLYIF